MAERELMRKRFPALSIDTAIRFGTNEIKVGSPAPDFELPDLEKLNTPNFSYLSNDPIRSRQQLGGIVWPIYFTG
jgi:hypothetical protein